MVVKHKNEQESVALFGGRLKENKPLTKIPLYSNLLYLAHIEAMKDATFPMHPHDGIEILTFVFEGALEHFDNASNKRTSLAKGGVQLIQAGKGVSHSEKFVKGYRAFQIWLDPDFSKSLKKHARYEDFKADCFSWKKKAKIEEMAYVGECAPIQADASGIGAKRYRFEKGNHELRLKSEKTYSLYVMSVDMTINRKKLRRDSFAKLHRTNLLTIQSMGKSELFVLESPTDVTYQKAYR